MHIIAIANQKGGVAKTTTAVTLAHGLAVKGKEVLLVDADPQGHCAVFLGRPQEPGVFDLLVAEAPLRDVVRTTGRPRLWLLPGNKRNSTAATVLEAERAGIDTLRQALLGHLNGGRPDYIVLDTPPSVGVGGLQEMALFAADSVLIPVAVDFAAVVGALQLTETMKRLKGHGWQGNILGVLPTFYDEQTRESRENLGEMRRRFGELVLPPIHRATVLRECTAAGETIFEFAPRSRAAEEYARLVWEVLDVTKKR
jgi:chromosome partitioning protein